MSNIAETMKKALNCSQWYAWYRVQITFKKGSDKNTEYSIITLKLFHCYVFPLAQEENNSIRFEIRSGSLSMTFSLEEDVGLS